MKAQARILAIDTTAADEAAPLRFWGAGLLAASLASWALVIGAARLIAHLV
ncbi:MAG TPA: hypothetical protein VN802_22120 [Stellaceae bacterium]|nr:hypothetical protein [Stellaceae bacterium]